MNVLDWFLVVLVLAYAVSGYWQGFISGAFATGGLLLGGLFGIWVAPHLLGDAAPALWVSLAALFVVLICASFGQAVLPVRRRAASATGSSGSPCAPSTRSAARRSAWSPCSSSPGRSASPSAAPACPG